MTMRLPKIVLSALGGTALLVPEAAIAEDTPPAIAAVVTHALPAPRLATIFELKLKLPQGRGLARMLLDAGVTREDAGEAARLAAGHLGDKAGGCDAKVEISRSAGASGLRLERLVLSTSDGQTVIERRNGQLALNPAAVAPMRAAALI